MERGEPAVEPICGVLSRGDELERGVRGDDERVRGDRPSAEAVAHDAGDAVAAAAAGIPRADGGGDEATLPRAEWISVGCVTSSSLHWSPFFSDRALSTPPVAEDAAAAEAAASAAAAAVIAALAASPAAMAAAVAAATEADGLTARVFSRPAGAANEAAFVAAGVLLLLLHECDPLVAPLLPTLCCAGGGDPGLRGLKRCCSCGRTRRYGCCCASGGECTDRSRRSSMPSTFQAATNGGGCNETCARPPAAGHPRVSAWPSPSSVGSSDCG